MTQTQVYTVNNAQLTVTATIMLQSISISMTVDFSKLDVDEPAHSKHYLINYINLYGWDVGNTEWWCKYHRVIKVKTGSQAARVIKSAITKIDDAISKALLDRARRKAEMSVIF